MQNLLKIILVGSIVVNLVAVWGFYHYVRYGGSPLGELKRKLTGTTHQAAPKLTNAEDNARIRQELAAGKRSDNRIVFFGASITARWDLAIDFPEVTPINRGVGNQLAPAMLARFRRDVIDIEPDAVAIKFCSINIRPNLPNSVLEDVMMMMVELTQAHDIRPIVCTIIPAGKPEATIGDFSVAETLQEFNRWVRQYAKDNDVAMIDFAAAIQDDNGFLPRDCSVDPVHVNEKGYVLLTEAARPVIDSVLSTGVTGNKN